ncbi:hypothetical protein HYFRA_00012519 [Hymenoscyphus fraxineus]|uniref:Uncharacterized protein n=1 Tax=Hymenoscyphus fraxineus TaxID=746836 RepID=A0A9N9PVT2_9HELO|nr:hypothetical protein HYFRA_00012519 [Hymenoscyphus fraxineus]
MPHQGTWHRPDLAETKKTFPQFKSHDKHLPSINKKQRLWFSGKIDACQFQELQLLDNICIGPGFDSRRTQ